MYTMNSLKLSISLIVLFIGVQEVNAQYGGPPSSVADYEKKYQNRIRQEYLDGVYIPKNLTEVFVELKKLAEDTDLKKFKAATEQDVEIRLFPSLGRWIIHNWGFYGGSRLSHYLKSVGLTHPDDMSRFLMVAFHRTLNDKPMNVKELVTKYKAYREEQALKRFPSKKAIIDSNRAIKARRDSLNKN